MARPGTGFRAADGYQLGMNNTTRLKVWLRRLAVGVGCLFGLAGTAAAVMELRPPKMRAVDAAKRFVATPARRARGRHVVEAEAHCLHCHSDRDWKTHGAPVLPGMLGAGWDFPWADNHMPGPVFASNLTPDPETGLGAVPDVAFARAIREGVGHDGRALFMMPWRNFRHLSDEDVASAVVYLRALPAVKKARGATAIARPVSWFVKAGAEPLTAPVIEPVATEPVARGRQLAEIGQCRLCHTPVDARHEPLPGQDFAGGQAFTIAGVKYLSANITPDASGIAHSTARSCSSTRCASGNIGGRRLAPCHAVNKDRQADGRRPQGAVGLPQDGRARRARRPAHARRAERRRARDLSLGSNCRNTKETHMRIHHFTVPARDPQRVAQVLAELLGARVVPIPHPRGTLLVYADDADGTAIEVWPATLRGGVGEHELELRDLPLPEAWPHHAYVSSDACDADSILAVFAREGWRAEKVRNGPPGFGFSLVRAWIEDYAAIEIVGAEMRAEYERFFAAAMGTRTPGALH